MLTMRYFRLRSSQCLLLTHLLISHQGGGGALCSLPNAAVAYSADQDPYLAYRVTARMSIRPHAPAPFLFEEVAERLLALPTPPPSPLSPYSSPNSLRSRADGIRQRDELPSPVHENIDCLRFVYRSIRGHTWDDLVGAIQEIAPTTLEGANQRVIELATTVDQEDEIICSQLDDARYDRALLRARVNMLYKDRPFHRRTAILMEDKARLSRAAWAQSMDACNQTRSDDISLRTTRQLVEALKIVKSLKTQMIELQRQQGPAKDPAEPELPEEASSSS
ncbi:hypothetical protein Tco_0951000 [Tanacetum coccineum]|uniref:Uncharacterized protein n=1 Tax=Tanacetum coccineum TaxID=301880 RepID=A0ABQ5DSU8_9ASTR